MTDNRSRATTAADLAQLNPGDVVRHRGSGEVYVVLRQAVNGESALAVCHIIVSNPLEWDIVGKVAYR
jgi:hypothetical protein